MDHPSMQKKHPDWLVDAVPGARAKLKKWERSLDEAAPIEAAHKAALAARRGKVSHQGEPGNAILVPAAGVTTEEFDTLMSDVRNAEAALERHRRNSRALRAEFDNAIKNANVQGDELRAVAAREALSSHEAAERALLDLRTALAARDEAWRYAGRPGRDWTATYGLLYSVQQERSRAENYFAEALSRFDVNATRTVAEGQEAA